MILSKISELGRLGLDFLGALGRSGIFLFHMLTAQSIGRDRAQLLIKQLYNVGVLSFLIVTVSGFFIGMVLGLQGYTILSHYGSESAVGQLIALSIVRELGPVITALLFAGRAGSALTAEIGLMKASEQLSVRRLWVLIRYPHYCAAFFSLHTRNAYTHDLIQHHGHFRW